MNYNKILFGDTIIIDLTADTIETNKMLTGCTAHAANGDSITGTMPNNGAVNGSISTVSGSYTISEGYHNGKGSVSIAGSEQAKIIPENIKQGITILGVAGNAQSSSQASTQNKTVTPLAVSQNITPDNGYDYLSSVTIEAISYEIIPNDAGGSTIVIGEEAY